MTTRRLLRSVRASAPQFRRARYVPECQVEKPDPAAHVATTSAAWTVSSFTMIPLRSRAAAGCDGVDGDRRRTQARDAASVETMARLSGESFRERDRQDTTHAPIRCPDSDARTALQHPGTNVGIEITLENRWFLILTFL